MPNLCEDTKMLQNHLGQYERGEFRSTIFENLLNLVLNSPKIDDFDQKLYRKYSKIGVGSLESFLLVNLGWGQLWFTVEVNSKY